VDDGHAQQTAETIKVVTYDPAWPHLYMAERALVLAVAEPYFLAFEHIGSTAIPGLAAKPIIDMMAAVMHLQEGRALIAKLATLDYQAVETGMPNRILLRKNDPKQGHCFNLHIVEFTTWHHRNERLLRDYLLAHPEASQAYGQLKQELAIKYAHDGLAYTKAKTAFIQSIMDRARDEQGLPHINVWEEE
jgi:GrpB-like predicted nucleotidyltransferase (UPF0157 family)